MDQRVEATFKDAEGLHQEAMEELRRGKLRDAAEKAWGATGENTSVIALPGRSRRFSSPLQRKLQSHPHQFLKLGCQFPPRPNANVSPR